MAVSIAIVGGCGHVGLPLGIAFAHAGAEVVLLDIDAERVRAVSAGQMPFFERGADRALPAALATGRLSATGDPEAIGRAGIVVVTIGTPIDEFHDPQVHAFDRALDAILARMRAGQLLVLRSTVFPGVTDRLARTALGRGLDIDVAYCPERIAQGHALEELAELPQLVGGATPAAAGRAAALFGRLGPETIELPSVEAELAKLFANSYRYVNFAIANQFYAIAGRFGADFGRVRAAARRDYSRLAGLAPAGFAGGPCLRKDTLQLAAFHPHGFPLGRAAVEVNESLPALLVEALKRRRDLRDATVAILGMAFKGNSDDPRDSLAYKLRTLLTLECREVLCTDPFIDDPDFVSLDVALREADVVFLGAPHDAYRHLDIRQEVVDVFDFLPRPRQAAGAIRIAPRHAERKCA